MAAKTGISWTEATWNPIVGCTAVSPACDRCYAAREASTRLAHLPVYAGLAVDGVFTGEVRLLPERLDIPLRWTKPRMIFVNSTSDLFHEGVPDEYVAKVFAVMVLTPDHTYQVLTKRHGRMRSLLSSIAFQELVVKETLAIWNKGSSTKLREKVGWLWTIDGKMPRTWPLSNVWAGVSAEDQKWADIRIPALLATPAAIRFVSMEPLLGAVDLYPLAPMGTDDPRENEDFEIDWIIVGGESGPGSRRMDPAWVESIRDQCGDLGVSFFFKQAGEALAREWGLRSRVGKNPDEWPEGYAQEFPEVD